VEVYDMIYLALVHSVTSLTKIFGLNI